MLVTRAARIAHAAAIKRCSKTLIAADIAPLVPSLASTAEITLPRSLKPSIVLVIPPRAMLPSAETSREWVHRFQPQPPQIPAQPVPRDVSVAAAEPDHGYSDAAPSGPEPDVPALDRSLDPVLDRLTRDIAAITERYPLLRNVM